MTRLTGPCLPARVLLPDAPVMAAWHVRMALGGASKQVVSTWRKRYGFPKSHRDGMEFFTSTAALADWLRARDCVVQIVRVAA